MTRRVLIYRQGSLGDTIVALPCFHLIRKSFPDCEIRVLTNAPVSENAPPLSAVLEGSGLADGYFEYPVSTRDWRGLGRLARDIRAWRPDITIYLVRRLHRRDVLRDALFLRACGALTIVGLPLSRKLLSLRRLDGGMFEREAQRLARCLAPLGSVDFTDRSNWDFGLTDQERMVASRIATSGRYIALSTGTKQPLKDWGAANWQALVELLVRNFPYRIVLIGGHGDRALSAAIAARLPDRCLDLCGSLTVRESAAVISDALAFVGNDSGPMHLAAAVGTPVVGVFTNLEPPGMWFPMGDRVRVLHPYAPGSSIASITPEDVTAAVAELLTAGAS